MNKAIIKIGILAGALFLTGCNIDRAPETSLTDEAFWNTADDVKYGANNLYNYLPTINSDSNMDLLSDDLYSGRNSVNEGSWNVSYNDGTYSTNYTLIRYANTVIQKSDQVISKGVSAADVGKYQGEAYFFRAMGYFDLFKRFGGVPLILKTLSTDSPELKAPRASRDETIDQIYKDLDLAISLLPLPSKSGAANYGRITKTAALAFKSRVALFEGTRAKFHGYGDPVKHLTLARDAAKAVMDSNEHSLFGNYFNLFQYEGEGFANKENVLVRMYGQNAANSISTHVIQRNYEGGYNPTLALANSYLAIDGVPTEKSNEYTTATVSWDLYKNRDPRMSATFFKKGDPFISSKNYDYPSLNLQQTGFGLRKYANVADWTAQRSFIDKPIIRYAEVLLNYAESVYELSGAISDADLAKSIVLLRKRAGFPDNDKAGNSIIFTNNFVSSHGLNMRDEIRRERRVELASEGFRYWDLIRWKTAETELPKSTLGSYYYSDWPAKGTGVRLTPDGYLLIQEGSTKKFNVQRDYIFRFPTYEIALNPNLKQNPGW
ncbi:RagB/SusD family nutrient uptake outer membrane protein [Elizabethkingia anophelis]|nr:RagB/SusD family nutrient uptake outer membrane protein [Elizabethkingia anophelis]MCT3812630.1 RagB/SusD family nutrient uptake outer membrane protein [Elizabethkingia anophelis]MCT3820033.1 RagB/SusD family nutrient uptake outer membrane protein [Elizabethkingia anophelis]